MAKCGPGLHYSVDLRIQTYTEPVPLKYGKLATNYPQIYGHFLQCAVERACCDTPDMSASVSSSCTCNAPAAAAAAAAVLNDAYHRENPPPTSCRAYRSGDSVYIWPTCDLFQSESGTHTYDFVAVVVHASDLVVR